MFLFLESWGAAGIRAPSCKDSTKDSKWRNSNPGFYFFRLFLCLYFLLIWIVCHSYKNKKFVKFCCHLVDKQKPDNRQYKVWKIKIEESFSEKSQKCTVAKLVNKLVLKWLISIYFLVFMSKNVSLK